MLTEKELWAFAFRLLGEDSEDAGTYAQAMSFEAADRGDLENAELWQSVATKIASLGWTPQRVGQ